MTAKTEIDDSTQAVLSDPVQRRAWVLYKLKIRGTSLAKVAVANGVSRQTIYKVFDTPYPKMERIVAESVGLLAQQLFSERYLDDGSYFRTGERGAA